MFAGIRRWIDINISAPGRELRRSYPAPLMVYVAYGISAPIACCSCGIAFAAQAGASPSYPLRPLRFVVPFPPGGGADNLARIVGQPAGEKLGQQIVVDNRTGAGGNISAEVVARAAPDGYTLLQGNLAHAISQSLQRKPGYDIANDFTAVTLLASIPFLLVASPSINAGSVKELIALAKARPGQLNYASSGYGGPSHMAMELFRSMTGVDLRHVPYKGAAPAATDLIAGQVHVMFPTVSAALAHVRSGRLKGLAMTSASRSRSAPDIPTVAESGVPGYEATTWFGVMVPRGTPALIVGRLHAVFTGVLQLADVRERLTNQGFDIIASSPAEFASYIKAEIPKWATVARASGTTVD
jgi:tripartite-type tricarboxylate transporter receptor subunit TctC